VPARRLLTPETRMPDEYFLLNGAEHHQDQTDRSQLCEHSKKIPRLPAISANPRTMVKPLLIPMLCCALPDLLHVPAAGEKNNANHEPQQKKPEISKAGELSKHALLRAGCHIDM
jgi:hypothetical protein